MNYRIYPPEDILQATVTMPLSKSVSNRALIISALTDSPAPLAPVADCSDTRAMQHALASADEHIDIGDAGTAMRFLTAYYATRKGRITLLDGSERMRHRPIAPLVGALRRCGADIEYAGEEGFPPLRITGRHLTGGDMSIDASVSSQFISALLMIAPLMDGGLRLQLEGDPASLPYIDLTIDMMCRAGAEAERYNDLITVAPGAYDPSVTLPAEGDWSAASYWYEIEAITGGFLTIKGLNAGSRQPDRRVIDLFGALGAVTEPGEEDPADLDLTGSPDVAPRLTADLAATPDLTPAVAVTCAMIGVPFRLTGLQSLRIKECDRIAAIAAELLKIGVVTETIGDHTLTWDGRRRPIAELPVFDTYGDHRMAMALAPVSIYIPGIVVRDTGVASKSYPEFWDDLRMAGFEVTDADSADGSAPQSSEEPSGDES